jgi:beta-N-acetylhexosaminidase
VIESAIAAIQAGADMLVWTGDPARVATTIERLARAVEAGEIPEERIRASVARIAALKEAHALAERPVPRESDVRRQERSRDYAAAAYEIERRSVTVLYDRAGVLPLREGESEPVLVTGGHYVEHLDEALENHFKRVLIQPLKSAQHGGSILDFDVQRLVRQAAGLRTVIAIFQVGTADSRTPKVRAGQRDLVNAAKAAGPQVLVLLLGYPDNIDHLLEADAIVHAYPPLPDRGGPPLITQTIRAVADVLVGEGPLRILPPLRDIEAIVGQPEQYNALDAIVSPTGRLPVAIRSSREAGAVLFPAGHGMAYLRDDHIRRARWQFGDGGRANGMTTEYAHKAPGRYPITLSVEDQTRTTVEATFHVVVRNPEASTAAAE